MSPVSGDPQSGSPSADTVLGQAKAFEAYIFGEQP
jgi:hypothetical protein